VVVPREGIKKSSFPSTLSGGGRKEGRKRVFQRIKGESAGHRKGKRGMIHLPINQANPYGQSEKGRKKRTQAKKRTYCLKKLY